MAISSVNFQKTKKTSKIEIYRNVWQQLYLLPRIFRGENSYWENEKSEQEIFAEQRAIYDEMKKGKKGKRPVYENCVWEAVVNLNANHSIDDIKALADMIADDYNFTNARVAIHRDEGHLQDIRTGQKLSPLTDYYTDKKGISYFIKDGKKTKEPLELEHYKPIYNYHAHLNFVTLKDGQQNFNFNKKDLSELQTKVANFLNMERGDINSKAVRKSHNEYRREIAKTNKSTNQDQDILSKKDRNAILEQTRKDAKGQGYMKSFFDKLGIIKKSDAEYTEAELQAIIEKLKQENRQIKQDNDALSKENADYRTANKNLKLELEQERQKVAKLTAIKNELEAENKGLKTKLSLLDKAINWLKESYSIAYHIIETQFLNALESQGEQKDPLDDKNHYPTQENAIQATLDPLKDNLEQNTQHEHDTHEQTQSTTPTRTFTRRR